MNANTTNPYPAGGSRAGRKLASDSVAANDHVDTNASAFQFARRSLAGCNPAALVVLFGPAIALVVTPVLWILGAGTEAMAVFWIAAAIWTIIVSFAQAFWQGIRHGDWSAFSGRNCWRNDDDFDFFTRSGAYVDLQIRADDEALMRDSDRFLQDHDQLNPF